MFNQVEKAARFLNELQKEAESRITNALILNVSSIDAKVVTYDSADVGDIRTHHLAFSVNGRPRDIQITADKKADQAELAKLLASELAKALLGQIEMFNTIRLPTFIDPSKKKAS